MLAACVYLILKRKAPKFIGAPPQPIFPNANRVGIICLIVILVGLILGIYIQLRPTDKVIVQVADFVGPEPEKWGITQTLLKRLEEALAEEPKTKLEPLRRAISQQEGSETARKLGNKHNAAIVIWGWYAATEKACNLSVHFEILRKIVGLPKTKYMSHIAGIAELEKFALQILLSKEMTSLTLFTVGLIYYWDKEYEKAEKIFTEAFEETSETAGASYKGFILFCRGNSYSFLEKYSNAISDYSFSIENGVKYCPLFYNRGTAYVKLSLYDLAIVDYTNAITLDPKDAPTYNNRGFAYSQSKEYDKAIADYSKAIELNPKYSTAFNNRGVVYYKLKDYDKALADFSKAIELDPKYTSAYNNRGTIYSERKNYADALDDYQKAIAIEPKEILLRLNLAELYFTLGKIEQSENLASKIVKEAQLSEELAIGYYLLGISRKVQGKNTESVDFELKSLCIREFEINWSFSEIESWITQSNYPDEVNRYIYEKTEMLKKHIKNSF
jgi:tetratricopeptide (TPR) repeat protein